MEKMIDPKGILYDLLAPILIKERIDPEKGYVSQAIEILERRIAEGSVTDPSDYFSLGCAHYEAGNVGRAIEYTRTYTELVPEDPTGHLTLGWTLNRTKFNNEILEEGRRSLERAIELDPENPTHRYELSLNCVLRGDIEGQIENLRFVANSKDPEWPYVIIDAQNKLARILNHIRSKEVT